MRTLLVLALTSLGVVAGTGALMSVILGVYLTLLPLILLQAAGKTISGPFRRICMSFEAWLVAFGLSHTLAAAGVAPGVAYQLLVATLIIDGYLLYRFFKPATAARAADKNPLEVAA